MVGIGVVVGVGVVVVVVVGMVVVTGVVSGVVAGAAESLEILPELHKISPHTVRQTKHCLVYK